MDGFSEIVPHHVVFSEEAIGLRSTRFDLYRVEGRLQRKLIIIRKDETFRQKIISSEYVLPKPVFPVNEFLQIYYGFVMSAEVFVLPPEVLDISRICSRSDGPRHRILTLYNFLKNRQISLGRRVSTIVMNFECVCVLLISNNRDVFMDLSFPLKTK